ncbi:MAG: hypothetical protein JO138_21430 [Acidobacteriaceae bacterium]|nr:hypothetical protein [Acidobacteriaceae bacterium]
MDASVMGGPPRKLRDNAYACGVSPNGGEIAFIANEGRYGDREFWLMGADGERAHELYDAGQNAGFWNCRLSPGGQRVSYHKIQGAQGSAKVVIETRDLKGGSPTRVFAVPPKNLLWDFLWLPGRMIYSLAEPDINFYTCNYWEQPVDSRTGESRGRPRRLTDWAGFCMDNMSATADAQRLMFKRFWTQRSVYVADLDRLHITTPRRLTQSEENERPVGWTADSSAVFFLSNRTGPTGIFKQALHQGTAESVVSDLENLVSPPLARTEDGFSISAARNNMALQNRIS